MMEYPATPVKTLEKHYEIAKSEGLKYVYLGNVPGHPWEHTYCAGCNEIVVKRFGFDIQEWHLPITGSLAKGYKQERFQFVV
jgi:pyruvate formate lyase activating enzyme